MTISPTAMSNSFDCRGKLIFHFQYSRALGQAGSKHTMTLAAAQVVFKLGIWVRASCTGWEMEGSRSLLWYREVVSGSLQLAWPSLSHDDRRHSLELTLYSFCHTIHWKKIQNFKRLPVDILIDSVNFSGLFR